VTVSRPLANSGRVPLCVDLDGTLIRSDSLFELLLAGIRKEPWLIFLAPLWLLAGRAALKHRLAARVAPQPATLPYNEELLSFLRAAALDGTEIILVTAAPERVALSVAGHLGLFSKVFSSDGRVNLKGKEKARLLVEHFGERGFDYAGDSSADLHVWKSARVAILVGSAVRYRPRVLTDGCRVDVMFPRRRSLIQAISRELRVHQWAKNLLVFLPLILAHKLNDAQRLLHSLYGFLALVW